MTVGTAMGRAGARRPRCLTAALLLSLLALPEAAHAQTSVSGTVSDIQGLPLPDGTVLLRSETGQFVASAVTNREGRFAFPDIAEGTYVVEATLLGFATSETSVVTGGGAPVAVTLEVGAFAQEVTVSALMPELATELVATVSEIEPRVTQDLGQSLRSHAGVTALRRGAINLDPSVRGLYAEQIGVVVVGTRTFAAGPARMDSGLSHISPHALQSLRVPRAEVPHRVSNDS